MEIEVQELGEAELYTEQDGAKNGNIYRKFSAKSFALTPSMELIIIEGIKPIQTINTQFALMRIANISYVEDVHTAHPAIVLSIGGNQTFTIVPTTSKLGEWVERLKPLVIQDDVWNKYAFGK